MTQQDERSRRVEFQILGPLRVTGPDAPERTPRGVEARLLTTLLLEAGQVCSLPRLIDSVWDGDPPATAERQVRNLVSQLRRKLGPRRITNVGNGYQFDVDDSRIDARRFAELVRQAEADRAADDPRTARDRLRQALELWRGEPLGGMRGRLLTAAARRLAEARLTALEECADLELELADPDAAESLLRTVLAEHPHRQRTAGQLMLALYRQQRVPEALAVYERIRDRLAEDLGLDPSEQLRQRQRAVLRGEAEPTPPAPRPPAQLPADPGGFVGRAEALARLTGLRERAARSCLVTGAAGTGKTALAVHWAHRVREHYPDGQLFIDLRGFDHGEPVRPVDALTRLIRSLLGPEHPVSAELDDAVAAYRTLLHDKRVLVVLDNARDAAQVRPLLPSGTDGFTIVTSRHRLGGLIALDAVSPLVLPPLSASESVDLLNEADRRLDPATARRLARLCGHLPLALRIAAAQLTTGADTAAAELIARLDGPARLDALGVDGDPDATVATALELSSRQLDEESRELFHILGLLPGEDYSRELIDAVFDADAVTTRRRLDRLEAMNLLEQHHVGRYRFHDLTRLYAAERAERHLSPAAPAAVLDRFIDWHYDRRDETIAAEDANLLPACDALADHPRLWRLVTPLARRATNAGRLERVEELVAAATANAADDRLGRCHMASAEAALDWAKDRTDAAVAAARRAVALAADLDAETRWLATGQLGLCLFGAGRFTEAAAQLDRSLAEAPDSCGWHERFNRRLNLSAVRLELGQFEAAGRIHRELADEAAERGSPDHEFRVAAAAAWLLWDTGRIAAAGRRAAVALAGARRAGHHRYECELRKLTAMVHAATGDTAAAIAEFDRVIELARRIQRPSFEVEAVCELAKLYRAIGDSARIRTQLARLVALRPAIGTDPMSIAETALARCVSHNGLGEYDTALPYGRTAVERNAAMPRPLRHAEALAALADTHVGLGDAATAKRLREQARAVLAGLERDDAHRPEPHAGSGPVRVD